VKRPDYVKFDMRALEELNGNFPAALIYSQIAYWHSPDADGKPRLRAERKGSLWLVRQQEQLAEECCLSFDQVRRALEVLKREKFIAWESHFSPFHGGKRAMWITLLPRASNCAAMHTSNPAAAPSTISMSTENKDHTALAQAPNPKGNPVKIKDVLAMSANKQPTGIHALWKNRLALKTQKFQKPLTHKDMAQLKKIDAIIREAKCGPEVVVDWAIQNWANLVYGVGIATGQSGGPTEPQIGYLLSHVDAAIEGWKAGHLQYTVTFTAGTPTEPSQQKVGDPTPPVVVPPKSPEESDPGEALPSVAELDSALQSVSPS
jgi:hypothetical protein